MNRSRLVIAACAIFLAGAAAGILLRPWLYADANPGQDATTRVTGDAKGSPRAVRKEEEAIQDAQEVAHTYLELAKTGGAYSEAGKLCMTEQFRKSCPNYFPFVKPGYVIYKPRLSPNGEIVWVDGHFDGIKALDGGRDFQVDFKLTLIKELVDKWLISSFTMDKERR